MTASKRIFCIFTCILLMLSAVCSASAQEETTLTYGDFSYGILEDGTVCLTEYNGVGGDVSIPAEIDGKIVSTLGDELFWYKEEVTSVALPDTIEYIGSRVFQGCTAVTEIILPDSVAEIGAACFLGCSNLTEINVPANLVYVGSFAFDETSWITQFDGCSSIILGGRIFYKYMADEDMVVIPDGVVCISGNAFESKKLSFVQIPLSVAFIGDYCFYNCPNLKEIKLPSNIYHIGENSLGLTAGTTELEEVEGFVIYADENTLGAEYASTYEVELKAYSEFTEPASLPLAEECVPTAEIRNADKTQPATGLSHGAVIAIVLSIAGCVVIIGGIAGASYFYEKKRKNKNKENQKQNSKKKKK